MMKQIFTILSGIPATLIGGVLLLLSFFLPRAGVAAPIDPAWGTVIICGLPLCYLAIWRICFNPGISKISSALLISIAMVAAILIGDLFAAGEVAFIMAIGAILEDVTTNRAKKGLTKLMHLTPTQGRLITGQRESIVPAEQIRPGDTLRVLPGERIPVDGVILRGETSIDQSIVTGESLPVDKTVGEEVFCGTINCFGAIDIQATKVGENCSLQKLIRLVQEAEKKKAPMARIADKAASWLVPVALLIAVISYIITQNIVTAVTVLVVFCPCALALATPTAIMAAIGQATKHGIVIKSGEAIEAMGKADTFVFDKTGTLTCGEPKVCDILSFNKNISKNSLLTLAASAEAKSEHPLGKAIVRFAKENSLSLFNSSDFIMIPGKGISAMVNGVRILCGNQTFLLENGVSFQDADMTALTALCREGKASILVAVDAICTGVIALSDQLRESAQNVIEQLQRVNVTSLLFTGDNHMAADYFAKKIGIRNVYAELLPGQKAEKILKLQQQGKQVCMVGDGVNDAPSLKVANVGIAMGSMGSDIAVEAADIALMHDNIREIPYLKRLSKATVWTIKFSITLSMLINFTAIILSLLELLNPTTGALVHNVGSVLVVLIAALLYDRRFD